MPVIRGRVLFANGSPASGYQVQAYDQDLPSLEPPHTKLTELPAPTDSQGRYRIEYPLRGFETAEAQRGEDADQHGARPAPDIVVEVLRGREETLIRSRIHFNVEGDLDVEDLRLQPDIRPPADLSEYERLQRDIEPVLRGVPIERLKDEDLAFLEGETGWPEDSLLFLRKAADYGIQTELPSEVFYGLMRLGLPDSLAGLVDQSPETHENLLRQAAGEAAIVPAALAGRIAELVRQLQALRRRYAEEPPAGHTGPPLTKWLGIAVQSADVRNRFAGRVVDHNGNAQSFWRALRKDESLRQHVPRIQLMLQMGLLTRHHEALTTAVLNRYRADELRDLVKLKPKDWLALIQEADQHSGTAADADADEQAQRAATIVGTLQLAFPVEASAHAIAGMEAKYFQGPHVRDGVSRFLLNARAPVVRERGVAFELATTQIDPFVATHGEQAFAGVRDEDRRQVLGEVKRVQRLFRISTSADTLTALLQTPLQSAYAVARMPRRSFLAHHGAALGGEEEATLIHERAVAESAARLEIAMQMSQLINQPLPRGIGG